MEELNRKGFVSAGLYYIGSGRGLMVGPYADRSKLCDITKKQSNLQGISHDSGGGGAVGHY